MFAPASQNDSPINTHKLETAAPLSLSSSMLLSYLPGCWECLASSKRSTGWNLAWTPPFSGPGSVLRNKSWHMHRGRWLLDAFLLQRKMPAVLGAEAPVAGRCWSPNQRDQGWDRQACPTVLRHCCCTGWFFSPASLGLSFDKGCIDFAC